MNKSSLEQWVKQMSFFFPELKRIYNKYPLCLTMVRECLFHRGCSENRIKINMILILVFVRYILKYLYRTFKCQNYENNGVRQGHLKVTNNPSSDPFSTLWQKELSKVTLTQSLLCSTSPLSSPLPPFKASMLPSPAFPLSTALLPPCAPPSVAPQRALLSHLSLCLCCALYWDALFHGPQFS